MTVPPDYPPHDKINGDTTNFLDTLRLLAQSHTFRESLAILHENGVTVTAAAARRAAQRHNIPFKPDQRGGARPGAGRPQGSLSRKRPEGCSWIAGDFAAGGRAGDSADGMPPLPLQAGKRSGVALFDGAWALRAGAHLEPRHGRKEGDEDGSGPKKGGNCGAADAAARSAAFGALRGQ